jgi:hypothetical protein
MLWCDADVSVPTYRWEKTKKTYRFLDYFQILLPMVGWLRTYKTRQYLVVSRNLSAETETTCNVFCM